MTQQKSLFVLGAAGFIGRSTVRHALDAGWKVSGLVRSEHNAQWLKGLGADPVTGDATDVQVWSDRLANHDALVDLIQPPLPARLTHRRMQGIATLRLRFTTNVLRAVGDLPRNQRPFWFSVSGCNDLQPDASRRVDANSPLRTRADGFGLIGIPVRRAIEAATVDAAFLYLGHVYGPDKGFGETVLPGIAKGKFPIIGNGGVYLPLVHVDDVARAIVHLADRERGELAGRQFVVADGAPTTLKDLVETVADLAGAPRPGHVPVWLAKLASGSILINEMLDDIRADPATLLETGFQLRYPVLRDGLRVTMEELGLLARQQGRQEYA